MKNSKDLKVINTQYHIPLFKLEDSLGILNATPCVAETFAEAQGYYVDAFRDSVEEFMANKSYFKIIKNSIINSTLPNEVVDLMEELTWSDNMIFQYDLLELCITRWYRIAKTREDALYLIENSADNSKEQFFAQKKLCMLSTNMSEALSDYERVTGILLLEKIALKKIIKFAKTK